MQIGKTGKTIKVNKKELNQWRKKFMVYGAKTEFENETKIPRQTLHRILKEGKGLEDNVSAIRNFLTPQVAN